MAEIRFLNREEALLALDTATGSPAEAIHARFGWRRVDVIPDYALYPDESLCGATIFHKRIA